MNDRQRTEAIIFPVFFQNVLRYGVNDKSTEDYMKAMLKLQQAIDLVLKGCDQRRRDNLMRRACRIHNEVTESYRREHVRVEKMGLMALYALQRVLDEDYLVLEAGSDLAQAIEAIVEGLQDAFDEAKLDASARKQSLKLLGHMQFLGYFVGVGAFEQAA